MPARDTRTGSELRRHDPSALPRSGGQCLAVTCAEYGAGMVPQSRSVTCARAGTCLSRAVSVAPHAGETARNRSGVLIRQAIENDTLSWTEPKIVRFAQLETEAVQRPHFGPWSFSVVRMVPLNPFETTRSFGVAVGVCDGKLAEGMGFEPTVGVDPLQRFSKPSPSAARPPLLKRTKVFPQKEGESPTTSPL